MASTKRFTSLFPKIFSFRTRLPMYMKAKTARGTIRTPIGTIRASTLSCDIASIVSFVNIYQVVPARLGVLAQFVSNRCASLSTSR